MFAGLDGYLHEQWRAIPVERGLVLWPRDMYVRLHEYQLLRGERPGLEVLNPWLLSDPAVRRRFFARHGFDPLGDVAPDREALLARSGESPAAARYVTRLARRLAALSPEPVLVFEPEVPRITRVSRPAAGTPDR